MKSAERNRMPSLHIAIIGELSKKSNPRHGGTGQGLIRLANALHMQKVKVDIITSEKRVLSDYSEQPKRYINIYQLGRRSKEIQLLRLCFYLIKNRPNVLIARNTRAIDLGLWVKRCFHAHIKLICSIHHESVVRVEKKARLERVKQKRFKKIDKIADGISCVSPGILKAVHSRISMKKNTAVVIPNPAYFEKEVEVAKKNYIKRPKNHYKHLITVGRLSSEKRHDLIIHALSKIIYEKDYKIILSIIGDGVHLNKLKLLSKNLKVQDYVYFRGYVYNPLSYMADSDIFVLSSTTEAFGYVLVEALSMGLTVVSTDCPYGPRYILEDGKYGILVPMNDSNALACGIIKALNQNFDKNKLKEKAKEFNSESVAYKYLEMIYRLQKQCIRMN